MRKLGGTQRHYDKAIKRRSKGLCRKTFYIRSRVASDVEIFKCLPFLRCRTKWMENDPINCKNDKEAINCSEKCKCRSRHFVSVLLVFCVGGAKVQKILDWGIRLRLNYPHDWKRENLRLTTHLCHLL